MLLKPDLGFKKKNCLEGLYNFPSRMVYKQNYHSITNTEKFWKQT